VADPELTEAGVAQCEDLKNRLAMVKVSKVLTSPMLRCLQTSQLVFQGLEVEVRPDLYEQGGMWNLYQVFPGMTRSEISLSFPLFNSQNVPENGYFFLESRETVQECKERVIRILESLRNYPDETLAVVVHGLLMEHIAEAVSLEERIPCNS
jgi:broad specificity phosphatase PhoE